MALSSAGIGSNLDVEGIITKLMSIESQPLTVLTKKEATYQAKVSAYGTLKGALSTFQTAVQGLSSPTKFQALTASSSDTTVAGASASSVATAGSYAVDISKLAQSQKLVVAGQASMSSAIGAGGTTTLSFDFGTISGGTYTAYNSAAGTGGTYAGSTFASKGRGIKTVTIDATNNSLSGIRDAINNAKVGVTASIINDGGTSPYRLVLSSNTAGSSNSVKIDVSGDATISALLAQDPSGTQNLQQTTAAQNTEMTLNGVFISKESTSISDAVHGVTLSALKVGTSTITIAQDTSGVSSAVDAFVKGYNDLKSTINDLTSYDAKTQAAGTLLGDSTVRTVQTQMRTLLGRPLVGGTYSSLSDIGISLLKDGTMTVDSSKLQSALSAHSSDVAALFAATGKTSDSLVSYVSGTSNTKPGSYGLSVSQIATQGNMLGSDVAGLDIFAGSNDVLNVTVDGVATTVTLTPKSYATAADLAMEIQSQINGSAALNSAGSSVVVTESSGVLTIASARYGSASKVAVSGSAADNALGASRTSTDGLDVAGTINGVAASGSGQYLTGEDGLKVLVSGGAAGDRGAVNYSQGFAYQLGALLTNMLGSDGAISAKVDGTNRSITSIGDQRTVLNRRLVAIEAAYRKQYTALDVLMGSMKAQQTALTQQLASFVKA
ncbi:MAG: flagellar filament capping protein FliD [Sulfuricella sp.]|nr:flagellar filament capping protein FliD [Sulfuricella sp.]